MAVTQKKAAKVETAYGKPLPEPISFSYEYEELKKGDPIPDNEKPKDMDDLVLTWVNAKRNSAARAAAQTKALEAANIEAPKTDSPEVVTRTTLKNLGFAGKTGQEAFEVAKMILEHADADKNKFDAKVAREYLGLSE